MFEMGCLYKDKDGNIWRIREIVRYIDTGEIKILCRHPGSFKNYFGTVIDEHTALIDVDPGTVTITDKAIR